MSIPERIKKIREKYCGGSNIEFAEVMGESVSTTSNWVNRGASLEVIIKIADKFPKLNLNWLICGVGEMEIREDESRISNEAWEVIKNQATSLRTKDQQVSDAMELLREQMRNQDYGRIMESIERLEKKIDEKGASVRKGKSML